MVKQEETLLDPALDEYFKKKLGFKKYTPVQETAIEHFLKKYDCIVQAPTGSGKTLAYILPLVQILNSTRSTPQADKCEVLAVILAPSRELVHQITNVLRPLAEQYDYNVVRLVGGVGTKGTTDKPFKRQCIIVGTPARIDHILAKFDHLKRCFKSLEMLIVDEADRFADDEFRTSVSTILSCIPKQRRTGLFSATQAKQVEELLKFGLRNPIRINVTDEGQVKVCESANAIKSKVEAKVAPKELENFYTCVDANQKLLALVNFLNQNPDSKVLVFVCSSASVDYLSDILPHFLNKSKRQFLAVHRRKQHKRQKIIETFSKAKKAILLCTDLMARGLDITDIDWVVQYDIPKQSAWFVHRSGRTARSGRAGKALLMLTREEEAYAEFIKNYEHIEFKPYKIDGLSDEKARDLRENVREIAKADRSILLRGTRAFVSFIQFYIKHDSQVVCKLKDQDLPGIAHSFGLLRLPIMRELRGRKDLVNFEKAEVKTSEIAFKDKQKEAVRQAKKLEAPKLKTPLKKKKNNKGRPEKKQKPAKEEEDSADGYDEDDDVEMSDDGDTQDDNDSDDVPADEYDDSEDESMDE